LMAFSSDGDAIDFIYGVINWKLVDAREEPDAPAADQPPVEFAESDAQIEEELGSDEDAVELAPTAVEPIERAAPVDESVEHSEPALVPTSIPFSLEDGPSADEEGIAVPEIQLHADAGLADRLWAGR